MPLPMSIESTYSYANPQNVAGNEVSEAIVKRIESLTGGETNNQNEEIRFEYKNSLFYIPYSVTILIETNNQVKVCSKIDLMELIKVILLIMVGAIFVTTMAFAQYLAWSIVSLIIFYFINIWLVQSSIYRLINNALEKLGLFKAGEERKNEVYSSNTTEADSVRYHYKVRRNGKKDKRK